MVLARLTQAIAIAFVLATLCFAAMHALPGDIALRVAVARAGEDLATSDVVERIRRDAGLNQPLAQQYGRWISDIANGDLGRSLVTRRPVWDELWSHGRYTLQLGLLAWLVSYLLALPLGIRAGLRPGGAVDRITMLVAVALTCLPTFLIGLGLISVFALMLGWLPPAGHRSAAHLVLPTATLALSLAAFSVRVIRHAVADTGRAFFMVFARIKGQSAGQSFRSHGVRNSAIPVITFAALQFAFIVDGFVIVETLFNYPGIGELLVKALLARDIPVIAGASMVITVVFVMVNLLADLAGVKLDPRRHMARPS